MIDLEKIKYITEVFIGDEYTYIREGEGSPIGDMNILIKTTKPLNEFMISQNDKIVLIETNRPAQFSLFRTIFSFYGTEKNNFADMLKNKFVQGDVSYLEDLEYIIKKQLSLEGINLLISKNPLIYQNNKLILQGLSMAEWYDDIKFEIKKQKIFQINNLNTFEKYPFLTNLK